MLIPSRGAFFLERPFLGEGISGEGGALRSLGDLHTNGRRFRGSDSRGTQHGVLSEYFVVNLGDQIVLAVGIAAPHLPELNGIHGHGSILFAGILSRVAVTVGGVN